MIKKICRVSIIAIFITVIGIMFIFFVKPLFIRLSTQPVKTAGNKLSFSNSPLDKYDFTDCKVLSCYYNDEVYLTNEQKKEFLDVLFNLEMDKTGTSDYSEYIGVGNSFSYAIKFTNGEIIGVQVISDYYIMIGSKAYRCYNSDKLKFLDKYVVEIYESAKYE